MCNCFPLTDNKKEKVKEMKKKKKSKVALFIGAALKWFFFSPSYEPFTFPSSDDYQVYEKTVVKKEVKEMIQKEEVVEKEEEVVMTEEEVVEKEEEVVEKEEVKEMMQEEEVVEKEEVKEMMQEEEVVEKEVVLTEEEVVEKEEEVKGQESEEVEKNMKEKERVEERVVNRRRMTTRTIYSLKEEMSRKFPIQKQHMWPNNRPASKAQAARRGKNRHILLWGQRKV
ncbi:uncharacterized protein isoform X2 [Danio rerio]|uniref:Uncharacterized protein isoform X2 n=1 Tax=Danio rerio TaxID=7955 RepID=A0AC58JA04_DANRE